MKTIILSAILMASVLASCNQKNKEAGTGQPQDKNAATAVNDSIGNDPKAASGLFACSMHPEVQGKLNDECPKCGMKLTEPVPEKADAAK